MKQKMLYKWILLLISAILYPIPFYFPQSFFWLSFIYLVPLFYAGLVYTISYKEGYTWGLIALGGHELAVFYGLFTMAEGNFFVRMLPILFLVFFCPIFSSIWFFITNIVLQVSRTSSLVPRLMIWVTTAWLYELWMEQYQLWVFGNREGYLLLSPLIPLAEYSSLLSLLSVVDMSGLLLYLFVCSGMITYAIISKKWWPWLAAIFLATPWLFGFFVDRQIVPPAPKWISKLGVVQQKLYASSERPSVMMLQACCVTLQQQCPDITAVICPESSIYETDLALSFQAYAGQHDAILEALQVVLGGFYNESETEHRNTAYFLDHNYALRMFYKRHAMALTERMPQGFNIALIRDLYFKRRPQIVPSHNVRPLWVVAGQPVVPYICSELFFHTPDDPYEGVTILALCNDIWAPASMRYLMYLGAQVRAQEWQRDIIYVSYQYAAFITKKGFVYPLQTL